MSAEPTSNNSQIPTPTRPLTARELLRELITRNLEIIETRTSCLWARSMVAYNTNKSQTPKDILDALSDLISAPFLRLGKKYLESPITQEIVAASRKFNNLLIDIKREATLHIRGIAKLDVFDPASQRKIERLGLRFPIIKLDLEELIAADEADAEPVTDAEADAEAGADAATEANNETAAATAHQATSEALSQPAPGSTHPADIIIASEIAKITADATAAPTTSAAPTTVAAPTPPARGTPTPSHNNPISRPVNPQNKKRNRFKKRRAA